MIARCELCGEPMPPGEEMFKYHGFSGNCPAPPLPKKPEPIPEAIRTAVEQEIASALRAKAQWHSNYAAELRNKDMELAKTHKSISHTTSADAEFVSSGEYRKATQELAT